MKPHRGRTICFVFHPVLICFLARRSGSEEGAAQFHGDLEDLTIAGASAGGHLVALLLAEAVKKQLPLPVWPGPLRWWGGRGGDVY